MNNSSVALVREPSADEQLARRIRNFVSSKQLPGTATFRVDVDGGTVTLGGKVGSFYQKQLWIHGAQRVAGVIRVVDEIEVLPRR
jgi:osmotically-inducible protein OsmY